VRFVFVLLTFRQDAPAGIEKATAVLREGLRREGHEADILTAADLPSLDIHTPCSDTALRRSIEKAKSLEVDLTDSLESYDVVVWCDALWGLGAWAPPLGNRSVLMVHVVGKEVGDLRTALSRNHHRVVAVSPSVLRVASSRGVEANSWQVVPNGLLPSVVRVPSLVGRERLRPTAPVRLVARLGPEKGVLEFLRAAVQGLDRRVEVVLADAEFEAHPGSQPALREEAAGLTADSERVQLRGALPWKAIPEYLAGAAIAAVPSLAESFGLVALEAMSVGTPVVCYSVDNLPVLVGSAGRTVPRGAGASGLVDEINRMLDSQQAYANASQEGLRISGAYRCEKVAEKFLQAVL
jgi:glycosyltransferase involved in cell wall biosynthesis